MVFRTQTVEAARADAEKIKLIGVAEASSIEAIGKAEAESMRQKASAYKQYGDAALMSLVLESLPKVRFKFLSLNVCNKPNIEFCLFKTKLIHTMKINLLRY